MEQKSNLFNFDEILADLHNIIGQSIASTDKIDLITKYITKLEDKANGNNSID